MNDLKVGDAVIFKEQKQYVLRILKTCIAITNNKGYTSSEYQHASKDYLKLCHKNSYYRVGSRRFGYKRLDQNDRPRGWDDYQVKTYFNDLGQTMSKLFKAGIQVSEKKGFMCKSENDRYVFSFFNHVPENGLTTEEIERKDMDERFKESLRLKSLEKAISKSMDVNNNTRDFEIPEISSREICSATHLDDFLSFYDINSVEYRSLHTNTAGKMWNVFRAIVAKNHALSIIFGSYEKVS